MANVKVTNDDFVVAYATSETLEEVAKTTGMNKAAVQARKKFLEKKGVNFPKLSNGNVVTQLQVAQLNSLIIKHDIRRRK